MPEILPVRTVTGYIDCYINRGLSLMIDQVEGYILVEESATVLVDGVWTVGFGNGGLPRRMQSVSGVYEYYVQSGLRHKVHECK